MHTRLLITRLCFALFATFCLDAHAQQNTWIMDRNLADSATQDASNPPLVFDVSGGSGSPDYTPAPVDSNDLPALLLGTSLRLHENDATGQFQRVRVSSTVLGTPPAYRPDWSIALWFYRVSNTDDWLIYAGNSNGAGSTLSHEFEVWADTTGKLNANNWNASTADMAISGGTVTTQKWHHAVFVHANGNTGILYMDGQVIGLDTSVDTDPALNARSNLFFGGTSTPPETQRALDGYLDHIQVFTNALSSLEVLALYNLGRSEPVMTSVYPDEFDVRLGFAPFAGAGYHLQYANTMKGPWTDMLTPTRGSVAISQIISVINAPTQRFYRLTTTTNQAPSGMVWIEGGDVELGQAGIAEPVHTNYISSFWMDTTEVTKAKWDEVYNWAITNGYAFDNAGTGKSNSHPVVNVNWYDCVKWCNARSQKEGLAFCYYMDPVLFTPYKAGQADMSNSWVNWSASGYRLPTEAEWEKAARGGWQGRLFPWGGDTIQHARANYYSTNSLSYDTSPTRGLHPAYTNGALLYTSPTGSFPANGYGLLDIGGNASELCWDRSAPYSAVYEIDHRGPETGTRRIWRGGSWGSNAGFVLCASRADAAMDGAGPELGFRCVMRP